MKAKNVRLLFSGNLEMELMETGVRPLGIFFDQQIDELINISTGPFSQSIHIDC